ncbi:MAG: protein-tyrosine-phosphatase [Flavobacteriales bacterium]|jgi:arsenate reductase|nr:protein-tyrosine-phosphatase [Flavobacteriales bacterium]
MTDQLQAIISKLDLKNIANTRKKELQVLIDYIDSKTTINESVNLNFICTHNSRRSQFSQLWAQVAANYFGVPVNSYSGGVEVTAFNNRAVASIIRMGFDVIKDRTANNPIYSVKWGSSSTPLKLFSKLFDDDSNPVSNFAAIMTCSHADENCPFIPGAEARIPIRYEDPKAFDNTSLESKMYDQRSIEIATELFYVFSKIKKQ